jgi:uncharacterized membrane protein YoaK (UPF0700 family)
MCGVLIGKDTVNFGMAKYGMVLIGNCLLLSLTVILQSHHIARFVAASACGLQNGMATSYSSAVIRTTHVTGIATDIGLLMGRMTKRIVRGVCCRRDLDEFDYAHLKVDGQKCGLLAILFAGYAAGSWFGSILDRCWGVEALLLPACTAGVAGVSYVVYRVFVLHQSVFSLQDPDSPKYTSRRRKAVAPSPGTLRLREAIDKTAKDKTLHVAA